MQKDAWIKGDLEPGTRCADERNGKELHKLAVNGVHSRFRAVLSPQLLVDVVKGLRRGWNAHFEALRNFGGVLYCVGCG